MLDVITNAVTALQAETASYPQAVQVWMKVMGVSFLASVVFIRSRVGARWIFAALALNLIGLVVGKIAFPDFLYAPAQVAQGAGNGAGKEHAQENADEGNGCPTDEPGELDLAILVVGILADGLVGPGLYLL